jgi:hypothetical protein
MVLLNRRSTIPNDEDINQDYTVNLNEEYFQYRIDIDPSSYENWGELCDRFC